MTGRILIADDSTTVRRIVVQSLEAEGHEVIAVADGDDAFSRVCETRPDLVLADVLMPGRSGYDLAESIATDGRVRGTPVLLLSGAFEPFDEARAERCGAVGHLTKPFQAATLVDHVARTLASAPDRGEEAVTGPLPAEDDDLLGVLDAADGDEESAPEPVAPEPDQTPLALEDDEDDEDEDGVTQPETPPAEDERIRIALPGEEGFSVVPPRLPPRELRELAESAGGRVDAAELQRQLARKVDELAPEIIREVAWEVVPDLLERLLREAAEWPPAQTGRDESGEDR
jgi:CheY-like chemotaxis protein